MKEFEAYLFDADGTILDTVELVCQSSNYIADRMGVPRRTRQFLEGHMGLPEYVFVRDVMGHGRSDEFYAEVVRLFNEYAGSRHTELVKPFPGVKEGLARLAAMGKKLAVVTSRHHATLDVLLDALELQPFFGVVVTPDDTDTHKPEPGPALHALRALGAKPVQSVFVGDSEFDMRCGNSAGTATVFVGWSGNDISDWPVRPDFIAQEFKDLLPDGK